MLIDAFARRRYIGERLGAPAMLLMRRYYFRAHITAVRRRLQKNIERSFHRGAKVTVYLVSFLDR